MRNLIAALIAAVITASIGTPPAKAGVPCSVPFTLTNGTTADANQVMANYNAILTCLSVSAAANGINADITALSALTTPLTAAQAPGVGLPGVTGLAITNSGTTALSVNYLQAVVINASGIQQIGFSGSLTLALNTTGVNGLDTGALAASTTYYLYLIGNGSTIASLASLSSTAPTMPGGYTYSVRIGAWYSNTISQLVLGRIAGNRFMVNQRPVTSGGSNLNAGTFAVQTSSNIGTCATTNDTTVLTAFTAIPLTAIEAYGILSVSTSGFAAISSVGPATYTLLEVQANLTTGGLNTYFDLVLPAAQSLYLCSSGGAQSNWVILGWIDSVNAN
jgi:hypothetical protein